MADLAIDYDLLQNMATSIKSLEATYGNAIAMSKGLDLMSGGGTQYSPQDFTGCAALTDDTVLFIRAWNNLLTESTTGLNQLGSIISEVAQQFFNQDAGCAASVNYSLSVSATEESQQKWKDYQKQLQQYNDKMDDPAAAYQLGTPQPVYNAYGTQTGTTPALAEPTPPTDVPANGNVVTANGVTVNTTLNTTPATDATGTNGVITSETTTVTDANSGLTYTETTNIGTVTHHDASGQPAEYDSTQTVTLADGSQVHNTTTINESLPNVGLAGEYTGLMTVTSTVNGTTSTSFYTKSADDPVWKPNQQMDDLAAPPPKPDPNSEPSWGLGADG
ncbi:hypothetical protein KDK95_16315 [Actinospica sp. MGRD01-02]|uniref:Uncharacterized protein n=1 Tax=Actinospica acidithermotolerans TaxID=2828514 RepID=A0A941EHS4_9ACTN|nr:hypothetical protein [Actinospica acidithermotolerans]MBR7827884.1 hypothetical protein [Actinospica acidithermotolerans]